VAKGHKACGEGTFWQPECNRIIKSIQENKNCYASLEELEQQFVSPLNKAFGSEVYQIRSTDLILVVCKLSHCKSAINFTAQADGYIMFNRVNTIRHKISAHEEGKVKLYTKDFSLDVSMNYKAENFSALTYTRNALLAAKNQQFSASSTPTKKNVKRDEGSVRLLQKLRAERVHFDNLHELNYQLVSPMNDAFEQAHGERPYKIQDRLENEYLRVKCSVCPSDCVRIEFQRRICQGVTREIRLYKVDSIHHKMENHTGKGHVTPN